MKIIELVNLTKKYKYPVLYKLNYEFYDGKTYLIVGENGSGKSTLVKLILGLINPSSGYIKKEVSDISYVPDNLIFPEFLSIKDFLFNLGLIYKVEEKRLVELINELLNRWEIDGGLKLNELSKGMRQKVLLMQAFIMDGSIYIFDEPLNGLDKEMQEVLIDEINKLKRRNKTIIIISHQLNEFENFYDYKLTIKDGLMNEEFN